MEEICDLHGRLLANLRLGMSVFLHGDLASAQRLLAEKVLFRDLERAVKLVLRFMFYASPIIYGLDNLPHGLDRLAAFNPLAGIFALYRSAFFPEQLDWYAVIVGTGVSLALLGVGIIVFRRTEHSVLKEI